MKESNQIYQTCLKVRVFINKLDDIQYYYLNIVLTLACL